MLCWTLCFAPPGPKNLLFTISLPLLQRRKWVGRVRETPRGQRGHKGAVLFEGNLGRNEARENGRKRERATEEEKATVGIS